MASKIQEERFLHGKNKKNSSKGQNWKRNGKGVGAKEEDNKLLVTCGSCITVTDLEKALKFLVADRWFGKQDIEMDVDIELLSKSLEYEWLWSFLEEGQNRFRLVGIAEDESRHMFLTLPASGFTL